jgi:hypothetical protein
MMQLEGRCPKPRELMGKLQAAVKGTKYESMFGTRNKRDKFLIKTRTPDDTAGLNSVTADSVDKRRVDWLTTGNIDRWFDGWEEFLIANHFGERLPREGYDDNQVYVPMAKRRRIINPDESHLLMSTEVEKSGPRASVYHDPALGAPQRSKVVNPRHTTIMAATTAASEVFSLYMEFDGVEENGRVHPSWVRGVPRPKGFFGGQQLQTSRPACEVTPNGGSTKSSFLSWHDKIVAPVYTITPKFVWDSDGELDDDGLLPIISGPVIEKTDSGIGRWDMSEEGLVERKKRHRDGVLVYPGVPNGSAANQEDDQLFGLFKMLSTDQACEIVAEREEAAAAARRDRRPAKTVVVNLNNSDVPRVINGTESTPDKQRPFQYAFGPELVGAAWSKVGAVGADGWVDRSAALRHPKVREGAAVTQSDPGVANPKASKGTEVRQQHADAMAAIRR